MDYLKLALQEANEETGVINLAPLSGIASIDVLLVANHMKRGKYVNAHLHLNVAYVFEADESESLIVNKDETSGLKWVPIESVAEQSGEEAIIYVYRKIFKHIGITM